MKKVHLQWLVGILIIIVLALAWQGGYFNHAQSVVKPKTSETAKSVMAPLKVSLVDEYNHTPVANTPIVVMTPTLTETITTDTGGVANTVNVYSSGSQVVFKVSYDGITYFLPKTIPSTEISSSSGSYIPITLQVPAIGTYSLNVMQGTTVVSNGGTLNITSGDTANIMITNSKLNTGYLSTSNPLSGKSYGAYLVIKVPTTSTVSVSGVDYTITIGGYNYFVKKISDSQLSYYEDLAGVKHGGSATVPITIYHNIAAGSSVAMTISLVVNGDLSNFQKTGDWGPYAVSVASITINVGP